VRNRQSKSHRLTGPEVYRHRFEPETLTCAQDAAGDFIAFGDKAAFHILRYCQRDQDSIAVPAARLSLTPQYRNRIFRELKRNLRARLKRMGTIYVCDIRD
jgi:hypothetical protein